MRRDARTSGTLSCELPRERRSLPLAYFCPFPRKSGRNRRAHTDAMTENPYSCTKHARRACNAGTRRPAGGGAGGTCESEMRRQHRGHHAPDPTPVPIAHGPRARHRVTRVTTHETHDRTQMRDGRAVRRAPRRVCRACSVLQWTPQPSHRMAWTCSGIRVHARLANDASAI